MQLGLAKIVISCTKVCRSLVEIVWRSLASFVQVLLLDVLGPCFPHSRPIPFISVVL